MVSTKKKERRRRRHKQDKKPKQLKAQVQTGSFQEPVSEPGLLHKCLLNSYLHDIVMFKQQLRPQEIACYSSLNESMSLLAHPYQPSGIRMTLENADLWQSFHSIGTEMIITKHGRRMFPHCSVRVSGLQPFTNYVITMDIVPVDGFKYKWKKEQWEIAGAADPHPPCRTYTHPDSPAPGRHWMKQPLSFPKLKLTNNTLNQHGHIILLSMHRYYPRFHVVQADNPYTLRWGPVQSFSFPETAFTAVTAYQNPKITKLKIDHNPFAKGFREGGTHSHSKR
ncbi:T-box-containing protein TBX6L-like [Pelmatolapia mariae]|uniref:T-box-containing protein TBX6L-like n=1 Tax=Pelmatolapia mariae TaxID=158779 RepID=UPI002FE6100B